MTLTVDREHVYSAPAFEYSRISEYSSSNYINSIYAYYGVQPNAVSATTSANATPSNPPETTPSPAPPPPTPIPSPTATPTLTPWPTPAETAAPTPSARETS